MIRGIVGVLAAFLASTSFAQVWISPGGVSYHVNRSAGFNEVNHGIAATWKQSEALAYSAGSYANSLHLRSYYALARYTPAQIGYVRLGAIGGMVTGYDANGGGPIPIILPAMAATFGPVEATVIAWPSVYGSGAGVALNLAFKVW